MLTLTQIKSIVDLTYIPFGMVLLFAPLDIMIKIILFLATLPATILGLTNPQKSEAKQLIYDVVSYFVQPLARIEVTIIGIIISLVPLSSAGPLILAFSIPACVIFVYIAKGWLFGVILASWKKDNKKPLIRM